MALDWPAFLEAHFAGDVKPSVVANIPYNITSPLLTTLLEQHGRFSRIVLLVQKEVAVRLAQKPEHLIMALSSVFVQYHAEVETIGIVSRRVFFPPPDVDSAIVRLTPHAAPPVDVPSEAQLFAIVRAAFGQRRKALLNALSGDPALGWGREQAAAAIGSGAELTAERRGETLTLAEFARLADVTALRRSLPDAPGSMIALWAARGLGQRKLAGDNRGQRPIRKARAERGVKLRQIGLSCVHQAHAENAGLRCMVRRGSISTGPRLPMTTTRPFCATTPKSLARLTFASISRMISGPLPPVSVFTSSK